MTRTNTSLWRRISSFAALAITALPFAGCVHSPERDAEAAPNRVSDLGIPETDAGLPGEGPIRRYDWFQPIWNERRGAWAQRGERDKGAVVFVGDSITQGWGETFGGHFPGLKTANRGIGGDTTRGILIRLKEDVLALEPRAVVMLMGTNDLEEGAAPHVIAGNVELILLELLKRDPNEVIFLCEVFPSSEEKKRPAAKIRELNQRYADLAARYPQVKLVKTWSVFADAAGDAKADEFPDLLHPNDKGYAKWAAVLKSAMRERGLLAEKTE